jgi:uncharacterized protein (TIGR01244 family)
MKYFLISILALTAFATSVCVADDNPVAGQFISATDIKADAASIHGKPYVSSGQPDQEVLSIAKDAGIVAVLDLRGASEDRGMDEVPAVEALGMRYISLPIDNAAAVNFENAAEFNRILDGIDGPVLVHCGSGNRVGALFALRASLAGDSDEEALAAGKAAGLTRLEGVVKERLQSR